MAVVTRNPIWTATAAIAGMPIVITGATMRTNINAIADQEEEAVAVEKHIQKFNAKHHLRTICAVSAFAIAIAAIAGKEFTFQIPNLLRIK
jgi:hypothetical protein